jgi:hypothetical protein
MFTTFSSSFVIIINKLTVYKMLLTHLLKVITKQHAIFFIHSSVVAVAVAAASPLVKYLFIYKLFIFSSTAKVCRHV